MSVDDKVDIKKKVLESTKGFQPCELPIGVYSVTKDGEFVRCNPRAREMLQLPQNGDVINANINDFYCDPEGRSRLLDELENVETEGKFLEKKIVRFRVKGQEKWFQDNIKSVKNPKTGEIIGYIGCLVDVTEEESNRQLFDKLPVGVYKLDAENKIVRINQASADILGYNDPSELVGIPIDNLYADKKEAERFDDLIMEKGFVVNERVELVKKTKERCYLSVCAYKKTDMDGETYIGVEGTIMDVTAEENYRQIRDTIPVGTFMVARDEGGKEIIKQCNKAFADMFGYETEEIINKDVKELYATDEDYQAFVNEITEKYEHNEIMGSGTIRAKTSKGSILTLEVHPRVLSDSDGNVIGRVGIVLDISNEVALRELREDIGKVLHFYSSTLVTLEQSINPVLRALAPDPFTIGEVLSIDRAVEALNQSAMNLKNALSKLVEIKKTDTERRSALTEINWTTLENQLNLLDDYQGKIAYPEFQLAALHESSRIILDIYNGIKKGILHRETTRDFFNKAKELERICCLIKAHHSLDTIIEVDYTIRALREFVVFQQRPPDPPIVCNISTLIQNVVYQLYLFAQHRKVVIKQDYQSCNVRVKVNERSVMRALANLLYNAIKYSWFREKEKPWVSVKAADFQDNVHVEFQNYGVPITKEEIENELIFRFGYRGKHSGDRRRMGTGVGLSDARETARKHGGDVVIESRPASGKGENDYNQPFITTATFIIPICYE